MKKTLIMLGLLLIFSQISMAQLQVDHLRVENREEPIGLNTEKPRFSWQLKAKRRNVTQSAYEIQIAGSEKALEENATSLVWQTGKVEEQNSIHIPYEGNPLTSGMKYFWRVRIWDDQGNESAWSPVSTWTTALFNPEQKFQASWIEAELPVENDQRPSPIFRKGFKIEEGKKIKSAYAYITAHGMYEAYLNGNRIGDDYLTPGWTSYHHRLQYQTYDVSEMLKSGDNAVGAMLGSGWYRGFIGFSGQKNYFGEDIALLFQLDITYEDGTTSTVISDGTWTYNEGPVVASEIYNGEHYDARKEIADWTTSAFDAQSWKKVSVKDYKKDNLIATYNEPVRRQETFEIQEIMVTPEGDTVLDFGQNLVGFVELKVTGEEGHQITLSHAEVLDKYGNFYTENLRAAEQEDTYILSGNGTETFSPKFTFQGFRYVKIQGFPGEISKEKIKAVALYSDMETIGNFSSSNEQLNQLQHNIQWGQKGNFLDVPTDCPQRDERLGWTGDAQVFFRTAAYNMDVSSFFSKWMKDVAADQLPSGSVPFVVPNVLGEQAAGSAGWGDVATIIPWGIYQVYGDQRVLADQYESMKAWVNYQESKSTNDLWNTGFHFGDWLFYRPFDDNDGRAAVTDKYLVAQSFFAHSTQLLINAAKVLEKSEDVDKYEKLLERIKAAYVKEYMTPNGRLVSGTQTAYVLALQFDMLPDSLRQQAADRLVENIRSYDTHLTTGFLGTPYLCHVLSKFGHDDVAYDLLMQDTYPSWLYPVTMGATTIWERWDGIKPDSTFQTPTMNSFNHYSYGAIGDWMYRNITGIQLDDSEVAYKHSVIKPVIGGDLNQAEATLETKYGLLASGWSVNNQGELQMTVTIPANTVATIFVPASNMEEITENGQPISEVKDIHPVKVANHYAQIEVGSGEYRFVSQLPDATSASTEEGEE